VPYFAPLNPGRVLSTFGVLSGIVEGLNGLGVSFRANSEAPQSRQNIGRDLTIAALVLQLVVIVVFVFIAVIFHRRCIRGDIHVKAVSTPLITLYISMSLILVRCIYRTIEQSGHSTIGRGDLMDLNPTLRYEWFFYVFEASPMLFNSVLWNVRHPRRYLPESSHIHLAQDGKTEVEGKIRTPGRPWLSLLTFGIFFHEKRELGPFLELSEYSNTHQR